MVLMFRKKEETFWTVRKLLLNHVLLHFPHPDFFTVEDVRLDFALSRKRNIPESAGEVLREVLAYDDIGIKVSEITPSPTFLELLRASGNLPSTSIIFTLKQLTSLPEAVFSAFASMIRFRFGTDKKKQAKAERAYLEKYRKDKLVSRNKRPILGYDFTEKLFTYFINTMVKRHGRSFQLEFPFAGLRKHRQLQQAFKALSPDEYQFWQQGGLRLRLAEHILVWIVLQKQLEIESFSLATKPGEMTKLGLRVLAPKPTKLERVGEKPRIRLVEVLRPSSEAKSFSVYLNQNYLWPLTFRRKTKTGWIIYALATEGSIDMKGLEKIFDYFQQYERFPFYKQGWYMTEPVLAKWVEEGETKETFIVPHSEVEFRLITESDIRQS